MEPVKLNVKDSNLGLAFSAFWETAIATLVNLEGEKKAYDFINSDIHTENPTAYLPKVDKEDEINAKTIFAYAAVGNLKLLERWSNNSNADPSYLGLLAFQAGLYSAAASGQRQAEAITEELGGLAEHGKKFSPGSNSGRLSKSCKVIEEHFKKLMSIDGKQPSNRDLFDYLPTCDYIGTKVYDDNEYPEFLWLRDSVREKYRVIKYKAFKKRLTGIRKKHKR